MTSPLFVTPNQSPMDQDEINQLIETRINQILSERLRENPPAVTVPQTLPNPPTANTPVLEQGDRRQALTAGFIQSSISSADLDELEEIFDPYAPTIKTEITRAKAIANTSILPPVLKAQVFDLPYAADRNLAQFKSVLDKLYGELQDLFKILVLYQLGKIEETDACDMTIVMALSLTRLIFHEQTKIYTIANLGQQVARTIDLFSDDHTLRQSEREKIENSIKITATDRPRTGTRRGRNFRNSRSSQNRQRDNSRNRRNTSQSGSRPSNAPATEQ